MQNVKQIWQETAKQLQKVYDKRESENIAYLLFEDLLGVDRPTILAESYSGLDTGKLDGAIRRLLNYEPIQYVTGIADFYGRKFEIASGALIPRPETEELVSMIVRENAVEKPKILDVGVGSGCIAIILSLEIKGEVFGTDVSVDALKIAKRNAQRLGATVSFYEQDILKKGILKQNLDIIVSNPPYIPEKEKGFMHSNVLRYEPKQALFVPDDDPILFYQRIAEEGLTSLKQGGKLYFEIHENFGKEVQEYLIQLGYMEVSIHQDMQGKDRMISAINSANT